MNEFEKIQAELREVGHFGPNFDARAKAAARLRAGRDRSFIVHTVVWFYVILIAVLVLFLLYRGVFLGKEVLSDLEDVFKWAIFPPFMLIIGYYFGTQAR
jgi:hypothetical protein